MMLHGTQDSERFAGLTDGDLAFLVGETAPDAKDPERLMRLVQEDEQFRQALVGDDRVFRQVVEDEEILVKISPALYFEVLLRRAAKDMEVATHTVERTGSQSIPVFDTDEVVAAARAAGRAAVPLADAGVIHAHQQPGDLGAGAPRHPPSRAPKRSRHRQPDGQAEQRGR